MPHLERAQAQLKDELNVARALQSAILPVGLSRPATAAMAAARMTPATTMGGDFYDFIELPDGRIGIVMADVSGKGVPAAFFMAVSRTSSAGTGRTLPRSWRLSGSDQRDPVHAKPAGSVSLRCSTASWTLSPACSPMPTAATILRLIARADGSIEALDGEGGLVLGVMPGVIYPNHTIQLRPDDRLVLYTDGVTEAFNPADEAYGVERLLAEIRAHRAGSTETLGRAGSAAA